MKTLLSGLLSLMVLSGCVRMKTASLFEMPSDDAQISDINGFTALSVFNDQVTSELWFTVSPQAIQVKSEAKELHSGSGAISIDWNKQADPSTWLGMGIGWDNWTGKDISSIQQSAALSFWVKMKKGQSTGLPWAIGFEDFNGAQAWTGVTAGFIKGGTIGSQWTQVIIPLSAFPFEGYDVDVTNIKQLIVQFESSGKVWVDDIRFIPYKSTERQTFAVKSLSAPKIDGQIEPNEWPATEAKLSVGTFRLNWDETNLYLAAEITDSSPGINNQTGENIWNGDALEFAFSSANGVNPKRAIYYPSDHHIGFQIGGTNQVFDWTTGKAVSNVVQHMQKTAGGYTFEAAIPWKSIGAKPWISGLLYELEFAVDLSNESGTRASQSRWNSTVREGFNTNPALWGTLITLP